MSTPESCFDDLVRSLTPAQRNLLARSERNRQRQVEKALREISRALGTLYNVHYQGVNALQHPELESLDEAE